MAYWCGLEFVQNSHGLLVWSGVCPEFTRLTGVVWSLSRVHMAYWSGLEFVQSSHGLLAYWSGLEFVQSSQGLLVWSGVCQEFTRLTGVVWSLSIVHKAYWCGLDFTLFIDVVCSLHRLVGLSRVHIGLWSGLEFTLFSGVV